EASGTKMLKNIAAGKLSSNPFGLTAINNKLLFFIGDEKTGIELWSSDGTESGTVQLFVFDKGNTIEGIKHLNHSAFYFYTANEKGKDIWYSNSNKGSTKKVSDLSNNKIKTIDYLMPTENGRLFFLVKNTTKQFEMYSSDANFNNVLKVSGFSIPSNNIDGVQSVAFKENI